ncbi:hypothetical protein BH10PSE7_BH10PSE7_37550 [soil metagenome]
MTTVKGWDVDDKGTVKAFPVVGWSTATFKNGQIGGLRFDVAMDRTMKKRSGVQLALTVPQVRKLSEMLAAFADKLEAAPANGKPATPKNGS